jgi:hypothetical protein
LQPVNEEGADDGTAQDAASRCVLSVGTIEAVRDLAWRMIVQLSKPLGTTIPINDPRVRLKGFHIPFSSPDTSGRWGHEWPGSRLTGDDMRKLAVLGNYAKLPTNEVLHIAVGVLYEHTRAVMLRLLDRHEETGKPFPELLDDVGVFQVAPSRAAGIGSDGDGDRTGTQHPQADARALPNAGHPTVAMPVKEEPAIITGPAGAPTNDHGSLAAETAHDGSTSHSIPPHPMTKRTTAPAPREGITDDRIQELAERMQRLQETMEVLIGSMDEFRDDLVHTLRNLPDQLPAPVHIHSLPVDPTASDFGERINVIPQEVMARLRKEAASGGGASAVAAAAEGEPSPAPLIDGMAGNGIRPRQGRLFG